MLRKILLVMFVLLLTGCSKAVVYDEDSFEWVTYSNTDLGISFEHPDYYGDTFEVINTGTTGESFYIRFLFDYLPDDPYLVYINGTTLDYAEPQLDVRVPYNGAYSLADYCKPDHDFIPYIFDKGEVCETVIYNGGESTGMLQNVAMQDLVTNSIERMFFGNFPENADYNGLQVGFLVPFDYVKVNTFASAQVRGNLAVDDILERMDEGRVKRNLLNELSRFERMVGSIEYL